MAQDITAQNLPEELAGRIPTLRVIAMPRDSNPAGDIFGGWILSQMDLAGAAYVCKHIYNRVVTVGVQSMSFHKPVFIGDEVSFYTEVVKFGNTSVSVKIESWVYRRFTGQYIYVTDGIFTYVAIDEQHKPVPINKK